MPFTMPSKHSCQSLQSTYEENFSMKKVVKLKKRYHIENVREKVLKLLGRQSECNHNKYVSLQNHYVGRKKVKNAIKRCNEKTCGYL